MSQTILFTDDDDILRDLYAQILRAQGYRVLTARDGQECARMIQSEPPDLVVLDIRMPRMDGCETIGRIIDTAGDVPIIIHSSYADHRHDFILQAADAWVEKSTDPEPLCAAIRAMLATGRVPA